MNKRWDIATEDHFQRRLEEGSQKYYRPLLLVAIPFYSVFAIVHWVISPPEVLYKQLIVRAIVVGTLAALYFRRTHKWFIPVFVGSMTLGNIAFSLIASGYEGSSYMSIGMLCFLFSNMFSWSPKRASLWVCGIIGSYLLAVSFKAGFHFDNKAAIVANIAFLFGCLIISIWGSYNSEVLKREIYAKSLALDKRDEFISIASHELKTPITALKLRLQMIQREIQANQENLPSAEKWTRSMESSVDHVDRVTKLIDDMLDLSQSISGVMSFEMAEFNFSRLLRETAERFSPQFSSSGIKTHFEIDPDVVGIWDPKRMEQLVSNLLQNVVKHAKNVELEIVLKKRPEGAVLMIRDQGPGVPAKFHQRIFDRFERGNAKLSIAGLGMGLHISKQIVLAHGGKISIEPNREKGATFVVELPYQAKTAPVGEA